MARAMMRSQAGLTCHIDSLTVVVGETHALTRDRSGFPNADLGPPELGHFFP